MPVRHRTLHALLLCILALGLAACVTGAGSGPRTRGSLDKITEAELEPIAQMSAFEAIQRLRPRWLQSRTGLFPTVHVDGSARNAGEEILASIPCSDVQEMQYMNASDATTRFGTDYVNGLILITTKK
ncbi:MAG: hypothetical protein FIA95_14265 [Gemmatimonadetes bacterium]|nr:hypothetical protein [Gemmatimonadota bacterium]